MRRQSTILLGIEREKYNGKKFRESGRKFKVDHLPADLRRVYGRLEEMFGEDYALTVVFTIRTAVELHRAWHMSLLTSNILQQIKEKFKLRMTWDLGVIDLTFRMEDGLYELHRRVPYDYDSEYQNMYFKTAVALVEEDIGVHDALIFQNELKAGKHTCPGGRFIRDNPGRLLLYPFQAATCCVIFFSGDLYDAGVAALCGLVAGLIEWALSSKKIVTNTNESKILIDMVIGVSTGVITGVIFKHVSDESVCLRAVFLGTLYWFFYGTAFVLGLLEIIASELQTGVTRFLAVAVKTFVLSIGSAAGLTFVLGSKVYETWTDQLQPDNGVCDTLGLGGEYPWNPWWRIPLYLLCSVSVLGQYRFILMNYWAGLLVQLAAYVTQEYIKVEFAESHELDGMNTVFGDVGGAMASVVTACFISIIVDFVRCQSRVRISEKPSLARKTTNILYRNLVGIGDCLGLGRGLTGRASIVRAKLEDESKKQDKRVFETVLSKEDEAILVEDLVEAQEYNYWSLLMPAVYQLVPGSKLAMYWYNIIFPPLPYQNPIANVVNVTNETVITEDTNIAELAQESEISADSAAYALWLTSLSLALGLILGLAVVRLIAWAFFYVLTMIRAKTMSKLEIDRMDSFVLRQFRRQNITHDDDDNDPIDGLDLSFHANSLEANGLRNRKNGTPNTNDGFHSLEAGECEA